MARFRYRPTAYRPASASPALRRLPLGILFTGIGGLLLFVAFHNLPGDVDSFPSFIGFLTDEISRRHRDGGSGMTWRNSRPSEPKKPCSRFV